MMRLISLIAVAVFATSVAANEATPTSDVEARLDALEVLNVTAQKAPATNDPAPDPQVDAILRSAAQAEVEATQ